MPYKVFGLYEYDGASPVVPEFCDTLDEAMEAATEILDELYISSDVREHSGVFHRVEAGTATIRMWDERGCHGQSIDLRIMKDGSLFWGDEQEALEQWCKRMRWHLLEDDTAYRSLDGATCDEVMELALHVEDGSEENGRALWNPAAGKLLTWISLGDDNYTVWLSEMPFEQALKLSAASADSRLPWLAFFASESDDMVYRLGDADAEKETAKLRDIVCAGLRKGPWVLCAWGNEADALEDAVPLSELIEQLGLRLASEQSI